jgi:translation initiation factor IF-2
VIKNIPSTKPVEILEQGIGRINENDLKSAVNSKALIIGFRVKLDQSAENLQRISPVGIIASDIIYELVKQFEDYLNSVGEPNLSAELEVLAIFRAPEKGKQIIGGRISQGLLKNQQKFQVWRNEQILVQGRILNLQEQRKDVPEAEAGKEVGLLIEADDIIKVGDKLKVFV